MSTKGKIPTLPGNGGLLFSRASFLNGSIPVQFSPNQIVYNSDYYSGIPEPLPTMFAHDDPAYLPPTDWPAAGTLLRPPQVVWLTVAGAVSPDQYPVILSGDEGADVTTYPATTDTWAFMVSIYEAFVAAQTTIQGLRRGQTFVYVVDGGGNVIDGTTPDEFPVLNTNTDNQIVMFPHAPVAFPFFGGQFLSIYACFPTLVSSDTDFSPLQELGLGFEDGPGNTGIDPALVDSAVAEAISGSSYQGSLVFAPTSYPQFSKYAGCWYIPDLYTNASGPQTTPQGQDALNVTGSYLFSKGVAQRMVMDFWDYGFSWSGASAITADSIVAQIAAFFGFDSKTGQDVG